MAFMDSYLYLAQRLPVDPSNPSNLEHFSSPEYYTSITALATKCMVEHSFKPIAASAVATGILYFTREALGLRPVWSSALSRITGHDALSSKSVEKVLLLLDALTADELATSREEDQSLVAAPEGGEDSVLEGITAAVDALLLQGSDAAHTAEREGDANDENTPTKAALAGTIRVKMPAFTTPALKGAAGAQAEKPSPVSIADLLA